jgi:serine/threonine protein kinase
MLEIPTKIWKKIKGYTKPQKVFRTNSEHILCWKTTRLEDKKQVVIKLFDWEVTEQIKSESKAITAITKINHKNLVRVYDIKEDEELGLYYVMECWGEDLRDAFKYLPRQEQTIDIVLQVLEGLAELHKKIGAHRDIKFENIFIKDGIVKIGDYGLVKSKRFVTELTTIAGTHGYMAPEVLSGKPYDERCDIYSVGIVLLELLTGERDADERRLTQIEIPDNLIKIILKAMATEVKNRFASAEKFIKSLESYKSKELSSKMSLRGVPEGRRSNLTHREKIATLPMVARNDKIREPINQSLNFQRRVTKLEKPGILIRYLQKQFEQLRNSGNIVEAINIGMLLSQMVRDTCDKDNPYVAMMWVQLGNLFKDEGVYKKSLELYIGARAIDIRNYGENSPENIIDLFHLAELCIKQNDYLQARSYYQNAQTIVSNLWAKSTEGNLPMAILWNQIGITCYLLKEYERAITCYKNALQINQQNEGFAINLYNLALTYEAQGNKSMAEPLYKQSLEIAKKTIPTDDERRRIIESMVIK